jgi:F-type H+-transporting ATPase subunit a
MRFLKVIWLVVMLAGFAGAVWAAEAPAAGAVSAEAGAAAGAAKAEPAEHGMPSHAVPLSSGRFPITNSMVVTWIVAALIIILSRRATRKMQEVPTGAQNFWEWLVENLYDFLESIVGPKLVKRTFWFFATIFIFILFANWFGLLPGFGTIGWGHDTDHGFKVTEPLLRGVNADLNMTFAMAAVFFVMWIVWALQANGVRGFVLHIFGPKGDLTGFLKVLMIAIFILAGLLEVVTILFRPVTLSFRLYGNIFAGENMLESMATLVQNPAWAKAVASVVLPLPFFLLEVLVGLVQALVFTLLTAVFTMEMCQHEEEHGTKEAH